MDLLRSKNSAQADDVANNAQFLGKPKNLTTGQKGWSDPDFREGKSTVSKCNKTVVDHIIQIPVEYHIHTTIISEYK